MKVENASPQLHHLPKKEGLGYNVLMINFRKDTDPLDEEMLPIIPNGAHLRLGNVAGVTECVFIKTEGEFPKVTYMFWDPEESDCFFLNAEQIAHMNAQGGIEIMEEKLVDKDELVKYENVYRERVRRLLED